MMIEPTADAESPNLGSAPMSEPDDVDDPSEQEDGRESKRGGSPSPLVISRTVDAEALSLAREVVGAASDKGATDIVLMDIRKLSIVADYFVICTGDNERQLRAISRAILDVADEHFSADPLHKPSSDAEASGWVLIDFGPVVVHVFSPAMRDFYRLERLWSEAATLLQMQ